MIVLIFDGQICLPSASAQRDFNVSTAAWIAKGEFVKQINEAALQNYRDGWAVGDSDIILAKSPDSFTFTWLPANNQVERHADSRKLCVVSGGEQS